MKTTPENHLKAMEILSDLVHKQRIEIQGSCTATDYNTKFQEVNNQIIKHSEELLKND